MAERTFFEDLFEFKGYNTISMKHIHLVKLLEKADGVLYDEGNGKLITSLSL